MHSLLKKGKVINMNDYKVTHCLATIISDLRDDNKCLDDLINSKNNRRNEDSNKIAELKAENKRIRNTLVENAKMFDELNKRLNDCSNVAYVELLERGYKKEIESLQDQLKDAVNDYESLLNSNSVK